MVSNLSAAHVRLMVSVWSKFDATTSFYREMVEHGFQLNDTNSSATVLSRPSKVELYYDPYSEAARQLFYSFSRAAHFEAGVEALRLDATEPQPACQP